MRRVARARRVAGQRGFALLVVLWGMVLLALLTAQVTAGGRAEARLAAAMRVSAQLEAAADGAVQEAIWHMMPGGGDAWPIGAGLHVLRARGATVELQIEDERGKLDINQVPPLLLAALFEVVGADRQTARLAGVNIAEWRSVQGPGDAQTNAPPEYRMEGRAWGPGGAPFERLEDIKLVRGMTPALFEAAAPYLTLALEQGPWTAYVSPTVAAALQKAKRDSGIAVDGADPRGPVILRLTATASGPQGARFIRRVLLRFDGELSGPTWKYRILDWR